MKWILWIIGYLAITFPIAVFLGKFIQAGSDGHNVKEGEKHADAGKDQVSD